MSTRPYGWQRVISIKGLIVNIKILACFALGAASTFAAPDPYDYKELTTTASNPIEIREGLFDFGKDGVGWLEMHGAEHGEYVVMIGEMTNAQGHVANPYPGSTIRCQRVSGRVCGEVMRFRMPADPWNLIGYDMENAPAIQLPRWAQIVFPFRYAEVLRKPGRLSSANLVRKMVHYPIDMNQSSFECDNAVLTELYGFFKYSILATSFCGVYVDGDRERTPYEADAYINQLCQYAIDSDYSLARKSHEWLMEHPTWPTEWKQHSIKMAWADWMWTGDTRSLAKYYGKLQKKLLGNYSRRDIVDWPMAERDGFVMTNSNSVVDAFHCRNLVEMGDIAEAIGKTGDAERYRKEAAAAKARFVADYFDADSGLFRDAVETRHSSLHANAIALAFGLVPDGRVDGIVAFLEQKGLSCSVYFAQYLLEAFFEADRADIAIKLMASEGERSWKAMLDFGSTISMEAWNMKAKPNQDLNHAWGSVPLNMISRYVLGVTPLEPGFSRISIRPQIGELRNVKGVVPTAKGPVEVMVRDGRLSVSVPAPARVVWFGRIHDVHAGHHQF